MYMVYERGWFVKKEKKKHPRQPCILRLEHRIPSEVCRAPRRNDLAVCAAFEKNGLRPGTRAVRECAECPRGARRKAVQHAVEAYFSSAVQGVVRCSRFHCCTKREFCEESKNKKDQTKREEVGKISMGWLLPAVEKRMGTVTYPRDRARAGKI
jgi:hypothetical protein